MGVLLPPVTFCHFDLEVSVWGASERRCPIGFEDVACKQKWVYTLPYLTGKVNWGPVAGSWIL